MSKISTVAAALARAEARQAKAEQDIKNLRKTARKLSFRVDKAADALAGRAARALLQTPEERGALIAKARELSRESEAEALGVLIKELSTPEEPTAPADDGSNVASSESGAAEPISTEGSRDLAAGDPPSPGGASATALPVIRPRVATFSKRPTNPGS